MMKFFFFAIATANILYAAESCAAIPAVELPPPNVTPIAAIELPPPNVTPVAAVVLTPIAAIEAPYEIETTQYAQATAPEPKNTASATATPPVETYTPAPHPGDPQSYNPQVY